MGRKENGKKQKGKEGKYHQTSPSVRTAATEDDKKAVAASAWPNPVFKQLKLLYSHNGTIAVLKSSFGRRPMIPYLQTSQQ